MTARHLLPYLQWLVDQLKDLMPPAEWVKRATAPMTGAELEALRRHCLEWARTLVLLGGTDMCTALCAPLPRPPAAAHFSHAFYVLERVAALCAVSHEALLTAGGKLLLRNGDVTGLVSICIYGGSSSCALRAWALPELLPRLGSAAVALLLDDLRAETLTTDGQMLIARGLLRAEQTAPAIRWATAAQSAGLPCAAEALGEVALDAPRALRACDLHVFVEAAQQQGDDASALLLAHLQVWPQAPLLCALASRTHEA